MKLNFREVSTTRWRLECCLRYLPAIEPKNLPRVSGGLPQKRGMTGNSRPAGVPGAEKPTSQEILKGSPISQRRLRRRLAPPEKYYYMTLEVIICLIIRIHLQGKPFLSSKLTHCFSGEAAWH